MSPPEGLGASSRGLVCLVQRSCVPRPEGLGASSSQRSSGASSQRSLGASSQRSLGASFVLRGLRCLVLTGLRYLVLRGLRCIVLRGLRCLVLSSDGSCSSFGLLSPIQDSSFFFPRGKDLHRRRQWGISGPGGWRMGWRGCCAGRRA